MMIAGITSGSNVTNSTIGRMRGRRSRTRYAVGTTMSAPSTIAASASPVENRNAVMKRWSANTIR